MRRTALLRRGENLVLQRCPEGGAAREHGVRARRIGNDMFEITREEIEWGGRPLVLETGRIARQADGAVLATYGETTVLATVVAERSAKPGLDFFPLTDVLTVGF